MTGGNPEWTRDEWLIALAFYQKHRGEVPSKTSAEIKELSETLRQLRGSLAGLPQTFRNPNGVFMQVAQFAGLDPSHHWQERNTSKLAHEVWQDYGNEKDAHQTLFKIEEKILKEAEEATDPIPSPEVLGVAEAKEGRILTYQHVRRERSSKLVEDKKEQFQKKNGGRLFCEACTFDYENHYGKRGKGFIEAHHLRALSELPPEGGIISLEDLILLCASCHRMIHRRAPWLDPDDLKSTLQPFSKRT